MSDFWKAQIMTAPAVLELTGQEVNEAIFTVHPTGNLIHVLVEKSPEEFGGIIIPDYIQSMEKMGIGYIIAAGPKAGDPSYSVGSPPIIGVVQGEKVVNGGPVCLLGLHVIFSSHTGMPLRVSMMDREFRAPVLVMSAKDIRGVDTNPVPLTRRVEERMKT